MKTIENQHSNITDMVNKIESFLYKTFFDYLHSSQIHGYQFILSKKRPVTERLLWFVVMCAVIWFTIYLMLSANKILLESPVETSENPTRISVLSVPFPAIALCSENRISHSALMNFSQFM